MFNTWILAKYITGRWHELYSWWSGGGVLLERVKTTTLRLLKKYAPRSSQNHTAPLTYSGVDNFIKFLYISYLLKGTGIYDILL